MIRKGGEGGGVHEQVIESIFLRYHRANKRRNSIDGRLNLCQRFLYLFIHLVSQV